MLKSKHTLLMVILVIAAILVSGCAGRQETAEPPPEEAGAGDTVKVHYTGKLQDGTVFDSSLEREPLELTIGQGKVIAGFEHALIGMKVGQSVTATIKAEDAYGPYYDDRVFEVPRSQLLLEDLEPQVGQILSYQDENGTWKVTVIEVSESTVTLDFNHPLAGKDLTFEIELVEIVEKAQ
ncbi:MAG: peptidylprolyl isomerase [Dehalococcoidia bacterium]|nr:peptidylprolyl isomerase [Dehalococcoidia bacterium]